MRKVSKLDKLSKVMKVLGYIIALVFAILYTVLFGTVFILLIVDKPLFTLGLVVFGVLTYLIMHMMIELIDAILLKYKAEVYYDEENIDEVFKL